MAPLSSTDAHNIGDFKDQQFSENEVADKVVEQCEFSLVSFCLMEFIPGLRLFRKW